MSRSRRLLRIGLHGLLTVWMAALAVAPLWHAGHETPPAPADESRHSHQAGAWICDDAPDGIEPGVDCVLCKAQRQLSQSWARVPGVPTSLQAAATPASPAPDAPRAGERTALAPRAPPHC